MLYNICNGRCKPIMSMVQALLAFAVVMVIILLWYAYHNNCDGETRRRYEKLLGESAGIFDWAARTALDELETLHHPNPHDYFAQGRILQLNRLDNLLDGEQNRQIIADIANDYTHALTGLRARTALQNADIFIADQIENFWRDAFADNTAVTTAVGSLHTAAASDRRDAAVENAVTKSEAVGEFFDESVHYTSDMQNVHDGAVNADLRKIYKKLKEVNPADVEGVLDCVEASIHQKYSGGTKLDSAMKVLLKIREGNHISTLGATEDMVLARVWERSSHWKNTTNKTLMRDAILEALTDCVEGGNVVCINGRCGRLLNSLVTLDYDTDVAAGAMTGEVYRNQIFQEAQAIFKDELSAARSSSDSNMVNLAHYYDGLAQIVDANTDVTFKERVRGLISRNIDGYTNLPQSLREKIKSECYIGIDI